MGWVPIFTIAQNDKFFRVHLFIRRELLREYNTLLSE